jgi:Uma2 family endonuclease
MAKRRAESDLPRTLREFDRWHAQQPERWEFIAGVPVMMAPGSNNHSTIKGNIFAVLRARLAGSPCRAFVDGPEVKSRKLSAIPDVVVTCRAVDGLSGEVREPVVIVEVLSPWSERDDTGRKWHGYCVIPSLQHYLVVSQEGRFVTVHTRTGASSFEERIYQDDVIDLPAIGVSLTLDEIYENVAFEAEAEAEPADD